MVGHCQTHVPFEQRKCIIRFSLCNTPIWALSKNTLLLRQHQTFPVGVTLAPHVASPRHLGWHSHRYISLLTHSSFPQYGCSGVVYCAAIKGSFCPLCFSNEAVLLISLSIKKLKCNDQREPGTLRGVSVQDHSLTILLFGTSLWDIYTVSTATSNLI